MRSLLLFMLIVAGCGEAPDVGDAGSTDDPEGGSEEVADPSPEPVGAAPLEGDSDDDPTPDVAPSPADDGPVPGCLPDLDGVLQAA